MLKKLSKKLAAAAAAVVLAAGAAGAGASAQTNTIAAILDIAPGERQCITHPTQAQRNASVSDSVLDGAPVKFIFLSGTREISESGPYPVLGYSDYISARPSFPPSFIPDFFPGYFRTCARNEGTQFSTVYLSLTVDQ